MHPEITQSSQHATRNIDQIARRRTRNSLVANPAQVIFAKDGVSIRPTRSEAIAGRLSILRQQRMVFLTWLPYSQGCLQEDGTFQPPADASRSPASAVGMHLRSKHRLRGLLSRYSPRKSPLKPYACWLDNR